MVLAPVMCGRECWLQHNVKNSFRLGPYSHGVGNTLKEAVLPMLGLSLAPVVDDWLTAGRASVFTTSSSSSYQVCGGRLTNAVTTYWNVYFSEYHDGVYKVVANTK